MAEVLLYRAILRTTTPSPPPALITGGGEEEEQNQEHEDIDTDISFMEQMNWEDLFTRSYSLEQLPNTTESEAAFEAMLNAAEKCGGFVTQFVMGLTHRDFDALWYGCMVSHYEDTKADKD